VFGDIFTVTNWGREEVCYWHLMDRGQGAFKNSTMHRAVAFLICPRISIATRWRN
jgi:hypothetical protein